MRRLLTVLLLASSACSDPKPRSQPRSEPPPVDIDCGPYSFMYACKVQNKLKDRAVRACWTLLLTCHNGATPRKRMCVDVEAGATASATVLVNEIAGFARCDMEKRVSIRNTETVLARY
jgi:hypothetical protein